MKHLGRNGGEPALEVNAHQLQKCKQVGADRCLERVPPAEDDQGERDPAGAFSALGPPPAGLGAERKGGAGKSHQQAAADCIEQLHLPGVDASRIGRLRVFADGPKLQAG